MAAKPLMIPPEVQSLMASLGIAIPENPAAAAKLIAALGAASKQVAKANKAERHEIVFTSKAVKAEDGSESSVDIARLSTGRKGKPAEMTREQAGIFTSAADDFARFLNTDFGAVSVEAVIGDKSFSVPELNIMWRQFDAVMMFAEGANLADCESARVDPPKSDDADDADNGETA